MCRNLKKMRILTIGTSEHKEVEWMIWEQQQKQQQQQNREEEKKQKFLAEIGVFEQQAFKSI